MIVRGRLAVRLAGRTRAVVPTALAEGLARLVVTGSFHRWVETEPVTEADAKRRVLGELGGAGWSVDEAAGTAAREDLSQGQDRVSCTVRVHAARQHPRGKPGVELEVVAVPLPASGVAGDAPALKARAERWLADRRACEQVLARVQARVEQVVADAEAAVRRALPVESVDAEVEIGLARGWDEAALAGLPVAAAAWMGALGATGDAGAWLGVVAPPADGGGVFDVGAGDAGGGGLGGGGHA